MTANRFLAVQRGLTEEEIAEIDNLHEKIEDIIERRSTLGVFNQSVYDAIEDMEYRLQELWGFPKDCGYHRYKKEYEFKCQWVRRKFKCTKTGEVFVIPDDVYETAFYPVGEGFVDVGRLNSYSRFSGVEEVKG